MVKKSILFLTDGGKEKSGFNECQDCTVRALALAGNISYAKAHKIARIAGRENGKGFSPFLLVHEAKKHGLYFLLLKDREGYPSFAEETASTFTKNHPTGRYMVSTRTHIIAVVKGKIRDTFDSGRRRVLGVWKLVE
jgi:hypothetical protein